MKYSLLILLIAEIIHAEVRIDTLKPNVSISRNCDEFYVRVTELVRESGQDTIQYDTGVSEAPFLDDESYNSEIIMPPNFTEGVANYDFTFTIRVKDKSKNALAIFAVYDDSKPPNIRYDSLKYTPETLYFHPKSTSFGDVVLGDTAKQIVTIYNNNFIDITIRNVYLTNNKHFFITDGLLTKDTTLADGDGIEIEISFIPSEPIDEIVDFTTSLVAVTNCSEHSLSFSGIVLVPKIQVTDVNFQVVRLNETIFYNKSFRLEYEDGITISNPGTGDLRITGVQYYGEVGDEGFFYENRDLNDHGVIIIKPNSSYQFREIGITPTTRGEKRGMFVFETNTVGLNSTSYLHAVVMPAGPYAHSVNFDSVRVGDSLVKNIIVRNSANRPIYIKDIYLENENSDFRLIREQAVPRLISHIFLYPETETDTSLVTSIVVPVVFAPNSEFAHQNKLIIEESFPESTDKIYCYLNGWAFLPKMDFNNYTFVGETLVGETHNDIGIITITSTSRSAPLEIYSLFVNEDANNDIDDFELLTELPDSLSLNFGESFEIHARFTPTDQGVRQLRMTMHSNAYSGRMEDNYIVNELTFIGTSLFDVLVADNLDFDRILACESETGYIRIRNLMHNEDAIITGITIIEPEETEGSFIINEPENIVIKANEEYMLPVTFSPINQQAGNYTAEVEISTYNYKTYARLSATAITLPVEIQLGEIVADLEPGKLIDFDIAIFSEFWDVLNFDIIEINLTYNSTIIGYSGIFEPGKSLSAGWELEVSEELIKLGTKKLTIRAEGISDYDRSGEMVIVKFKSYIGDSLFADIKLDSVFYGSRDGCIQTVSDSGSIQLNICGGDLRLVNLSPYEYSIVKPIPSPLTNDYDLELSLGLNAHLQIILYDVLGSQAAVLYNDYAQSGLHSLQIPVEKLPTGVYYLKIVSGPYLEQIKVLINK